MNAEIACTAVLRAFSGTAAELEMGAAALLRNTPRNVPCGMYLCVYGQGIQQDRSPVPDWTLTSRREAESVSKQAGFPKACARGVSFRPRDNANATAVAFKEGSADFLLGFDCLTV